MREIQDKLETLSPIEIASLYKKVFSSEEGKIVLQDMSNRFNPTCPDCPEDMQVDPYRTHINVGKRSVLFHIGSQLEMRDVEVRSDNT